MTNPMSAEALAARIAALQQKLINRTERRENYDDVTEEILRLREQQKQKGMDDATQKEYKKCIKKLLEKVTVHVDYLEFRFKSGVPIRIEK